MLILSRLGGIDEANNHNIQSCIVILGLQPTGYLHRHLMVKVKSHLRTNIISYQTV